MGGFLCVRETGEWTGQGRQNVCEPWDAQLDRNHGGLSLGLKVF